MIAYIFQKGHFDMLQNITSKGIEKPFSCETQYISLSSFISTIRSNSRKREMKKKENRFQIHVNNMSSVAT